MHLGLSCQMLTLGTSYKSTADIMNENTGVMPTTDIPNTLPSQASIMCPCHKSGFQVSYRTSEEFSNGFFFVIGNVISVMYAVTHLQIWLIVYTILLYLISLWLALSICDDFKYTLSNPDDTTWVLLLIDHLTISGYTHWFMMCLLTFWDAKSSLKCLCL